MAIELPGLPYPCEALEPLVSAATLTTHHGRHHRAYVDNLNALVRGTDLAGKPLEDIVRQSAHRKTTEPAMTAIFNSAAQAWNHSFYWRSLAPPGGHGPRGALAQRLAADFGGQGEFAHALTTAATKHFASGWAWLVADRGALRILTTANADTPILQAVVPLLVVDLWEHAYYLDYRADRARYVGGVVTQLLNWSFAEENFRGAEEELQRGAAAARTGRLGMA